MDSNTFRWLHISDFHAGMTGANKKWDQVRKKFLDDISNFIKQNGSIDLVIFSGDLTQAGEKEEFAYLLSELKGIWARFSELGCNPTLFCVPGNHDFTRPKAGTPVALAISNWSTAVEEHFLEKGSFYSGELNNIFKEYTKFTEDLTKVGIPFQADYSGALPGDSSCVITVRGNRIGLVGLNTAWSQWKSGDMKRHLLISEQQISLVLPTPLDDWSQNNDISLLVTHHPYDWLTDECQEIFKNYINPLGAFSGHLFGHMHESTAKFENYGHETNKVSLQAASLFGLEKYSEKKFDRRHGYYYGQVNFGTEKLKYWPRKAELMSGAGGWKIAPETASLPEGSFETGEIPFQTKKKNLTTSTLEQNERAVGRLTNEQLPLQHHLLKLNYPIPLFQRYMSWTFYPNLLINSVTELETERLTWHISPWDAYGDQFISALSEASTPKPPRYFRLDFSGFQSSKSFFSSIEEIYGLNYSTLVALLNANPEAILILDNVSHERSEEGTDLLEDAISIAQDILRSTNSTRLILRSRSIPLSPPMPFIYLDVMDEADTNQFILTHPLRDNVPGIASSTGEIHRLGGGYPGAIQRILNKLTFTSIGEVASESSEMAVKNVDLTLIDSSLIFKIKDLKNSENRELFDLLTVFCVFPYGENIQQLRNLRQGKTFYPMQSAKLVQRGLLNTLKHDFFDREQEDLPKIVISSDSINEYIRATDPDQFFELTERAIELYFGKDWRSGKYKLGQSFSLEILTEFEYSTRNATILLRRVFKDAQLSGTNRKMQDALGLINFYTAKLDFKCRHREICELLALIIDDLQELIKWSAVRDILFRYASAMRMLKNFEEAEDLYQKLLAIPEQTTSQQSRLNLNLALLYDELDDEPNTLKYAKAVKKDQAKKSTYYHARSILIIRSKTSNMHSRLKTLEKRCHQENHLRAANNIALRVANRFETSDIAMQTFGRITMNAIREDDLYNHVKACTRYVELLISSKAPINKQVIKSLKRCYDYARNQRLEKLFRSAHSSLWQILEADENHVLLGRLMALSSKTLRLLQDEKLELAYLKKLVNHKIGQDNWLFERDYLYIQGRIQNFKLKAPQGALEAI